MISLKYGIILGAILIIGIYFAYLNSTIRGGNIWITQHWFNIGTEYSSPFRSRCDPTYNAATGRKILLCV